MLLNTIQRERRKKEEQQEEEEEEEEEEKEEEEEEDVHSGSCVTWTLTGVGDLQFSFDFTDKPLHNISF